MVYETACKVTYFLCMQQTFAVILCLCAYRATNFKLPQQDAALLYAAQTQSHVGYAGQYLTLHYVPYADMQRVSLVQTEF